MNRIASLTLLSAALALPVSGSPFLLPLTLPNYDIDIRTFTDGAAYAPLFVPPTPPLGGISFDLSSGVNNAYFGQAPLHIPVGLQSVETAYTLINTAWGQAGSLTGTLTFLGSGGVTHTVDLIVGSNVRDHFFGSFVNDTSDPTTVDDVFGIAGPAHAHLDMQVISLPGSIFNSTLEEIVFQPLGDNPTGRAFLVGATIFVNPGDPRVPDGGSTILLLGLAGGLLLGGRRLSKTR